MYNALNALSDPVKPEQLEQFATWPALQEALLGVKKDKEESPKTEEQQPGPPPTDTQPEVSHNVLIRTLEYCLLSFLLKKFIK